MKNQHSELTSTHSDITTHVAKREMGRRLGCGGRFFFWMRAGALGYVGMVWEALGVLGSFLLGYVGLCLVGLVYIGDGWDISGVLGFFAF